MPALSSRSYDGAALSDSGSSLANRVAMNIVIWMGAGALIGWLTWSLLKANRERGLFVSIIIGVVGAFLGGYGLAPLFANGVAMPGEFSPLAFALAVATATGGLAVSDMVYQRLGI